MYKRQLEERFAHLEQIVARMEDADVSLDEAFELYKNCLLYKSVTYFDFDMLG